MSLLADLSVLLERAPGFAKATAALGTGDDFALALPPSIRRSWSLRPSAPTRVSCSSP
jgi:hypothetical protein